MKVGETGSKKSTESNSYELIIGHQANGDFSGSTLPIDRKRTDMIPSSIGACISAANRPAQNGYDKFQTTGGRLGTSGHASSLLGV